MTSILLSIAMLLVLCACGSAQPQTQQTEEAPEVAIAPEVQPEDAAEEVASAVEAGTVKVTFDLNFEGAPEASVIEVPVGGVIPPHNEENPNSAPATPTREGYRFAGWDKSADPVLENGASTTMWSLDDYYMVWFAELGPAMGALMMFDRHANLKYKFGNRHFWSEGYYVSTVGLNEATIRKYIQDQERADIIQDKLSVKEYEDPFKGQGK